MARLLPPQNATVDDVAREVGIGAGTLERWRSEALLKPARERVWTAAARFDAVLTTLAMDEAGKSAWCRYPQELVAWRQAATAALAEPEEARAGPQHAAGSAAHQGSRARATAQGQGAGRDGGIAGVIKKSRGDLQPDKGEDE